jgi:hypothetical protein
MESISSHLQVIAKLIDVWKIRYLQEQRATSTNIVPANWDIEIELFL